MIGSIVRKFGNRFFGENVPLRFLFLKTLKQFQSGSHIKYLNTGLEWLITFETKHNISISFH